MTKKRRTVDNPKPKFSFKKNVFPPLMGLLVMLSIFGLFNSEYLVAQYVYRFAKPQLASAQSYTYTPNKDVSQIMIPTLGITAPIVSEPSFVESDVQGGLKRGVVHFGTLGEFGKFGNVVIVGHSSGAAWSPGQYKFVFTMLDKIQTNDKIIIDYKGTRYIYSVKSINVVEPTNVEVLKQPKDKKMITLITCTPVGTSAKRLIVTGEQIVPKTEPNELTAPADTDSLSVPPSRIVLPN